MLLIIAQAKPNTIKAVMKHSTIKTGGTISNEKQSIASDNNWGPTNDPKKM